MTTQKSLKRRVRARMSKTGERYTAARGQLLAKAVPETAETHPAEPTTPTTFRGDRTTSDEVLVARTGRTWDEWFALLDGWGAADRPHPEIARWLNAEHGVPGWWAQEVTVCYEMAIGRRRPGQRPDGFEISASRTVGVPVERLFEAWVDEELRARWLPGVGLRSRTATPYRTARFDWEDGSTRLAVGFTAKGATKATVALAHQRLPDAETGERMRAFWHERLGDLKRVLEG
jgi:hypothetical protein